MKAIKRVLFWAGLILLALGLWKMTFLIVLGTVVLVASFIVETAADALEARRKAGTPQNGA